MRPGRLVIPDQLIDYTWGREHTFDDGASGSLMHIDITDPYDPGSWWRNGRQIRWVMAEYGAWIYYWWKTLGTL